MITPVLEWKRGMAGRFDADQWYNDYLERAWNTMDRVYAVARARTDREVNRFRGLHPPVFNYEMRGPGIAEIDRLVDAEIEEFLAHRDQQEEPNEDSVACMD